MIPLASPNRPAGSGLPDSPNAMDAVPKAAADAAMSFLVSMAVDGILEGVADSWLIRNPLGSLAFLVSRAVRLAPCRYRGDSGDDGARDDCHDDFLLLANAPIL